MSEETSKRKVNPYVSVDCVLVGFDGEQFHVLLVKQKEANQRAEYNNFKLPGSLIYMDEDLDDAAQRVLQELTGLQMVKMRQFRAFGGADRTKNPKDVLWLERFHNLSLPAERIVTIGYLSLLRLDRKLSQLYTAYEACWVPVKDIGELAFDHNRMIEVALESVRHIVNASPPLIFDLLPRKFTAAQLRSLYEVIYDKHIDVRNFHKRLSTMPYIVALDTYEQNVAHRAARYYKFDRALYNHLHS